MATIQSAVDAMPFGGGDGGTGRSTITAGAVLSGNSGGSVLISNTGSAGQVFVGQAAGSTAQFITATAGANLTVTANATTLSWALSATPSVTSITFGAGTALSVYAEGTYVPTLDGTVSGTTTYTIQQGYYTKVGNMVTCWGTVAGSAATGTGNATLGGFPFTIKNQSNYAPSGNIAISGAGWSWPIGGTSSGVSGISNTLTALIPIDGTAFVGGNLQMSNAAFNFQYSITYQV